MYHGCNLGFQEFLRSSPCVTALIIGWIKYTQLCYPLRLKHLILLQLNPLSCCPSSVSSYNVLRIKSVTLVRRKHGPTVYGSLTKLVSFFPYPASSQQQKTNLNDTEQRYVLVRHTCNTHLIMRIISLSRAFLDILCTWCDIMF